MILLSISAPVAYSLTQFTINQTKLEILKSLGGFYDGLALYPTGLNRLHISYNTLFCGLI